MGVYLSKGTVIEGKGQQVSAGLLQSRITESAYLDTLAHQPLRGSAAPSKDQRATESFTIEASADLTNWASIGTTSLTLGATATVTDPDAATFRNRFYRAVHPNLRNCFHNRREQVLPADIHSAINNYES